MPVEVVQQVVSKTDGVPLFVEELTKMVMESGIVRAVNSHYELTGPLSSLAIPATLQDSLMARLDRLSTAKEVAQLVKPEPRGVHAVPSHLAISRAATSSTVATKPVA